ncbi:AAA family ATPase [Spirosoma knui]
MTDEELDATDNIGFDAEEPAQQTTQKTTSTTGPDYAAMGEALRIRPDEDIPPPPVCLSIQQDGQTSTFGTLGNFSVLIGKAKSRKTFTTTIALAAALKRDVILNRFAGTFDVDKQTVLYFDTEQGRYHVHKVVKRICRLADQPAPANLLAYSLRSLPTGQRLGFIQWHIYNTPNVGLVVIDGIRDTVVDINDNAEATERVGDLLRWTEQRNIHILTVIHMNKSNDSIRGSIGTELQNKAETVVSVAVDPVNKDVSIVTAELCRDRSFEPFAFSINEQGLPFIVEDWQPDQRTASRKGAKADNSPKAPRTITPGQLTTERHEVILRRAFADVEPDKYNVTCHRIKAAAEYFGHSFGDNKAKEFVSHYIDTKCLLKVGKTYALNLSPVEQSDSAPEEIGLV